MNARQQPSLAPFDLGLLCGDDRPRLSLGAKLERSAAEVSTQHSAARFHAKKSAGYVSGGSLQSVAESRRCGRPQVRPPAGNKSKQSLIASGSRRFDIRQLRVELSSGKQCCESFCALGRDPINPAIPNRRRGTTLTHQSLKIKLPLAGAG